VFGKAWKRKEGIKKKIWINRCRPLSKELQRPRNQSKKKTPEKKQWKRRKKKKKKKKQNTPATRGTMKSKAGTLRYSREQTSEL